MEDRLTKWRMILGKAADPDEEMELEGGAKKMDAVLQALYDSDRKGGLGSSSPNINRWLGDIRNYFPTPVVQIMQKDAVENLGLSQLLMEPELLESFEPDVQLAATILSLNKVMPERTKATARLVVQKVVKEIEKKLKYPLQQAIDGAIKRSQRNRNPRPNEIDWHRTIRTNLKHYQPKYKSIIPEKLLGYGRKGQSLKHIILLMDQSGSMASSVVYTAIFATILSSIHSVKTHLVAFDTEVVDLSEHLSDPVELLFGTQLGGGTDINRALGYGQKLISQPADTIFILISDLYEGGSQQQMLLRASQIKDSGANFITLLALSDDGAPSYDRQVAGHFAAMDIPSFACTPKQFPDLLAAAIQKQPLTEWVK